MKSQVSVERLKVEVAQEQGLQAWEIEEKRERLRQALRKVALRLSKAVA